MSQIMCLCLYTVVYILFGNTCRKPSERSWRTDRQRVEQSKVHDGNWKRAISALCVS